VAKNRYPVRRRWLDWFTQPKNVFPSLVTGCIGLAAGLLSNLVTVPYTQHLSDVSARLREDRTNKINEAKEARLKQEAEAKEARLKQEAEAKEARLKQEKELADRLAFYRLMKAHLEASYDAFVNQVDVRVRLIEHMKHRLGPLPNKEYELLFQEYHHKFDEEEKRLCHIMKGISKTTLYNRNTAMLKLLDDHPDYYRELARAGRALREHLELWLSKYNSLMPREDTCLIYVGVEEHKPFPNGRDIPEDINKEVDQIISEIERKRGRANTGP
jgi:hypothetical protein